MVLTTACVISNNAAAALGGLYYSSPLCAISGSGSLNMSGLFDWQGGALMVRKSRGQWRITPVSQQAAGLGAARHDSDQLRRRDLEREHASDFERRGVLSNSPTGTFDCAADGMIQSGTGSNVIANAGMFRKSGGSGTTTSGAIFLNFAFGKVFVQSGTLNLGEGVTHPGIFRSLPARRSP